MAIRLQISCPFCGFSHYHKTVEVENGILPAPMRTATLPNIKFVKTDSGGRARIKHHNIPVEELHGNGGRFTERAILEQIKDNADSLSILCQLRMDEL